MLTKVVRFMMDSSRPSGRVMVSWGKSMSTSAISLPLSPHPTYMMPSLLLYLESAWEMTALPHPKAPGMAHVPKKTKCALSVMLQICCHCYCTGERLGNDCLATPESPRNGTCTWRIRCLISVMLAFAGTVTLLLRQHLRKDCHARPASHTTSACV